MSRGARRIALLCVDPWLKSGGNFRPFNYPVRRIEAALRSNAQLQDAEVKVFDVPLSQAASLAAEVEAFDPDLVGASAYTWSFAALLDVSARLKASRADRQIVFGGPSARPEMFALPPYREAHRAVDALVLGEGEDVVQELALGWGGERALGQIAGLAVPSADGAFVKTAERELPDLSKVASPYQLGLSPRGHTAHLETFRGCPLSCRFCQWGDLSKTNRVFSKEYLVRELAGFRERGATGAFIVDAALNLNARAFANLRAAEAEVRFLKTVHFNTEIYPSHMTDEHLAFLTAVGCDSVGIGLQSFDAKVLENMQRPFDERRFERVTREVAARVPDTIVEIIFGLPGDNRDSFFRTLERARGLGVAVRVYRCLVLPNALMTRAPPHFAMRFDPVTLLMQSCWGWSEEDLQRTARELDGLVAAEGGDVHDGSGSWKVPPPGRAARAASEPARSARLGDPLGDALAAQTEGLWVLTGATRAGEVLLASIQTPDGALQLELTPAASTPKSFCTAGAVAFSYRGAAAAATLAHLKALAPKLEPVVSALLAGGAPS